MTKQYPEDSDVTNVMRMRHLAEKISLLLVEQEITDPNTIGRIAAWLAFREVADELSTLAKVADKNGPLTAAQLRSSASTFYQAATTTQALDLGLGPHRT